MFSNFKSSISSNAKIQSYGDFCSKSYYFWNRLYKQNRQKYYKNYSLFRADAILTLDFTSVYEI